MPKTIEEIKRAAYCEALEVECDHEQRIAALEQRMAAVEAQLAELGKRYDAAWLDDLAHSVMAYGVRQP